MQFNISSMSFEGIKENILSEEGCKNHFLQDDEDSL